MSAERHKLQAAAELAAADEVMEKGSKGKLAAAMHLMSALVHAVIYVGECLSERR